MIRIINNINSYFNMILGIDEAGRGPLLGPLVVAGVLVSEKNNKKLKSLGVKDSKLLSIAQREEIITCLPKPDKQESI